MACLSRGVRESSGECTEAIEARLLILWFDSAVHLLFRHDCESRRTGIAAHRKGSPGCRREWGTGWRKAFYFLQSSDDQPQPWHPAQLYQRSNTLGQGTACPQSADDWLRQQPIAHVTFAPIFVTS